MPAMPVKSFTEYSREKWEGDWKRKVQKKKDGLGNEERVKRATEYKDIGAEKFKSGNTDEAIEYYREAYFYVNDLVDARRADRVKLCVPLCLNLARCYEKNAEDILIEWRRERKKFELEQYGIVVAASKDTIDTTIQNSQKDGSNSSNTSSTFVKFLREQKEFPAEAIALFRKMLEQTEEAVKICDIPRNEVSASFKSKAYLRRAIAQQHLGQYREAAKSVSAILKLGSSAEEKSNSSTKKDSTISKNQSTSLRAEKPVNLSVNDIIAGARKGGETDKSNPTSIVPEKDRVPAEFTQEARKKYTELLSILDEEKRTREKLAKAKTTTPAVAKGFFGNTKKNSKNSADAATLSTGTTASTTGASVAGTQPSGSSGSSSGISESKTATSATTGATGANLDLTETPADEGESRTDAKAVFHPEPRVGPDIIDSKQEVNREKKPDSESKPETTLCIDSDVKTSIECQASSSDLVKETLLPRSKETLLPPSDSRDKETSNSKEEKAVSSSNLESKPPLQSAASSKPKETFDPTRVFAKLEKKDEMLYEELDEKMQPKREKIVEQNNALELERQLFNIVSTSEKDTSKTFEEFLDKRYKRFEDQEAQMDCKKKVLSKLDKEKAWDEDEEWAQRQESLHQKNQEKQRRKYHSQLQTFGHESVECERWVRHKLQDLLVGLAVESDSDITVTQAGYVLGPQYVSEGKQYCVKALMSDFQISSGEAGVFQTKSYLKAFHYWDYSFSVDWEICVAERGKTSYREGKEIIKAVAATYRGDAKNPKTGDGQGTAPATVSLGALTWGKWDLTNFASDEQGGWDAEGLQIRRTCSQVCRHGLKLSRICDGMIGQLEIRLVNKLEKFVSEFSAKWNLD